MAPCGVINGTALASLLAAIFSSRTVEHEWELICVDNVGEVDLHASWVLVWVVPAGPNSKPRIEQRSRPHYNILFVHSYIHLQQSL